ncbi:hypothetical protein EIP86_010183 [Pleurotus ostreatoroseus]|nr:hypothetical protein EIP86_010183 [Pleurotus ostreatoroseus]
MIEALKANANHVLTTNNSPAYKSTLSPTLDAFQFLRPGCDAHSFSNYLEKAWHEDPILTLRLIWNLRSIHDGKNDKELFYQAYGWLYENHPRTAIKNLRFLVEPVCSVAKDLDPSASHGYWKDMLNIVALAVNDELRPLRAQTSFLNKSRPKRLHWRERLTRKQQRRVRRKADVRAESKTQQQQEKSRELRVTANKSFHSTFVAKLSDKRFRALYIAVARLFADQLKVDLGVLQLLEQCSQGKEREALLRQLSLAGKWAPTPGHSHDRSTNLATTIAVLVLRDLSVIPRPKLSAPLDRTDISTVDSHIVRSFYQRWILRPLRQVLQCPEPLMAANRWGDIMYTRVPSVCMKRNTLNFFKHDSERFEKYLLDVADGKKTISGATLLPHELLGEVVKLSAKSEYDPTQSRLSKMHIQQRVAETQLRTIEQQWKVMVDRLRQHGPLENSVAICDVSGSMGSPLWFHQRFVQPIHPAMALSLVIAQVAKPPFANVLITFSQHPEFVELNPADGLYQTCQKIAGANWGMNTDLNAVFLNLLLPLAIKHNLKQEDMIKRLFIFSDMQFDESLPKRTSRKSRFSLTRGETVVEQQSTIDWETNHDVIETAFKEAGYELPEIVYWNLAGEYSTAPVTHDKKGVSLMSGFSPSMMKVFLGEDDGDVVENDPAALNEAKDTSARTRSKRLTPVEVMKKVLSRKSYEGLVVVD